MVFVKIASKKNQNKMAGMMLAAQPWTEVCPGFSHPPRLLGPGQGSVWHGDRQTERQTRQRVSQTLCVPMESTPVPARDFGMG